MVYYSVYLIRIYYTNNELFFIIKFPNQLINQYIDFMYILWQMCIESL